MFKKILIGLAIVIALLVVVGLLLPTQYEVSRSVVIKAPAAKIHELVGDLKRWDEWTPWKEGDPTIVVTLGEQTTGVGASQSWTGDSGTGELTFTRCDPEVGIDFDMTFDQKYKSEGFVHYTPEGESTTVTWTMKGDMSMPVVGGYFTLLMDRMAGGEFEKGLQKLKAKSEG